MSNNTDNEGLDQKLFVFQFFFLNLFFSWQFTTQPFVLCIAIYVVICFTKVNILVGVVILWNAGIFPQITDFQCNLDLATLSVSAKSVTKSHNDTKFYVVNSKLVTKSQVVTNFNVSKLRLHCR